MTDTKISDRQLATMLVGLNGVTPGPWFTTGAPWFRSEDGVLAGSPDGNIAYLIADCDDGMNPRNEYVEGGGPFKLGDKDADAAHIARCDPDTIRALIIELQLHRAGTAIEQEQKPAYWTNGNGNILAADVIELQDEETQARFNIPLFLSPSVCEGKVTEERAEVLRSALEDLVSWFDGGPSRWGPWIIEAGEHGADAAVDAARGILNIDTTEEDV